MKIDRYLIVADLLLDYREHASLKLPISKIVKIVFLLIIRGLSQQRYKVLEMDLKGNLYLNKNALLCKYEIIKRLTSGKYHLGEQNTIGKSFTLLCETIENLIRAPYLQRLM